MTGAAPHIPVLLDEVVDALAIVPGERHVDCTFGAGGYTDAILERGAEVAAFDRDPRAIEGGQTLLASSGGRLTLIDRAELRIDELDRRGLPQRLGAALHRQRRIRVHSGQAVAVGQFPLVDEAVVTRGALQVHAEKNLYRLSLSY